ncbi:hypothetical protein QOZ80_2AG0140490 [Eleusine coracana subsp. coracana]|nr:hypothetical protein QOZ80_2AG0140490 [Eleusine coracana subsp. coracana]
MHLHAGGAVHLQYFMPQHHPEAATDLQHSAVRSSSTSPPATMWEYHQAALQSSSSSLSFPSWSPYAAGTTAALLSHGSTFAADSSPSFDMRLPASGEHVHSQAWGQHGEQSNNTCYKENFLDLLASKNMTPEMFEDAPAGHYAAQAPSGRFGANSDDVSPVKYEMAGSPLLAAGSNSGMHQEMNMMSCLPRYGYVDHHHQMKEGSNQQELAAPAMASFLQQLSTNNASVGLHGGMDYSGVVLDKICQESRGVEASIMRALPYYSSSGGYKPTAESTTTAAQPYMRRVDLSQSSKQEQDIVPARSSSTGSGPASDRKKRPSEERTSKVKKSKQEGSKASPPKQQVPKVKIGEKITALQQIVSPFGKTDTASVLFETIKYIKFLHEQVQLLSEPYTNSSRNKGNVPWGDHAAEASKQGEEVEHDLRDRGLCLVPVSCTPQVYRDGTAMDYWTPAYRGCLYR